MLCFQDIVLRSMSSVPSVTKENQISFLPDILIGFNGNEANI